MTRETFLFLLSIGVMALWLFVTFALGAFVDEFTEKGYKAVEVLLLTWLLAAMFFFVCASYLLAASLPSGGAK